MRVQFRRRALGAAGFMTFALSVWSVAYVGPANAYTKEGCHMWSAKVTYNDNSGYATATDNAAFAWSNTVSPLLLTEVSSGGMVIIDNQNNGNDGHDGVTYTVCPGGGAVWSSPPKSVYNTYYTGGYTSTERKQLMVHELGHALGLGHAGTSTCSGQPIMYYLSNRYWICNHQNPQTDDVNGINAIY
jgi:hypothetical protein